MSYFYTDYTSSISRKLRNPSDISEEEYEAAVDEAVTVYSAFFPLTKVFDSTGATDSYTISLPSDFMEGFSTITNVEFPYSTANQIPTYIKDNNYLIYTSPTGVSMRCLTFSPTTAEVSRITYSTLHTVGSTATTIPSNHEKAVANLGAAILCEMLAAEYLKEALSALPDVEFDLRYKARDYQTQADRYYALWRRGANISEDNKPSAACAWTDIDMRYSWNASWMIRGLNR